MEWIMETETELVVFERLDCGVCRISLNRPEKGNAQNVAMTYAINDAMMEAARDSAIKVIILAGVGKHFSTGHDLKEKGFSGVGIDYPVTSTWSGIETESIEGWYGLEREVFLDMCRRWRAIAKPTIAQVQGACIGGGLMLAWVCDLIVAAENAVFQDPVVNFGVGGVEYIVHAWELGARQAKEMLFTADRWTAQDALNWGMVNRIVSLAELEEATFALACQIAAKPSFALKLVKEAINGSLDAQGQQLAIDRGFALHQLAHAHNRLKSGGLLDPTGVPDAIRRGEDIPELVFGSLQRE
jgi:enoyl-CoA hydratase